jgi:hypothetical protein
MSSWLFWTSDDDVVVVLCLLLRMVATLLKILGHCTGDFGWQHDILTYRTVRYTEHAQTIQKSDADYQSKQLSPQSSVRPRRRRSGHSECQAHSPNSNPRPDASIQTYSTPFCCVREAEPRNMNSWFPSAASKGPTRFGWVRWKCMFKCICMYACANVMYVHIIRVYAFVRDMSER